MDNYQNDEDRCQYCNALMSRDLLRDHIICHEIENEDNNLQNDNINLNPNLNQNQNDQNYGYSNYGPSQNQIQPGPPRYIEPNNNLDYNNNYNNYNNNDLVNNSHYGPSHEHIQRGPPMYTDSNNNPNIYNNNNNRGNYNPIVGGNLNQNPINNGNDDGILGRIGNSIVDAFTGLRNIGSEIMNVGSNIIYGSNDNQPNYNYNRSRTGPVLVAPPVNSHHPNVIVMPPIVVGERGHVIDINQYRNNLNALNHNNGNNNRINADELNRIMEYLPSSVVDEKKEGNNNECVICLGEYDPGESTTTLPCLHIFHTDCIRSWLESNNHCPVCKFEITLNSIMREH